MNSGHAELPRTHVRRRMRQVALGVVGAATLSLAFVGAAPDAIACSYHATTGAFGPSWSGIIRYLAPKGSIRVWGRIEASPPPERRYLANSGECGPVQYGERFMLRIDPSARSLVFSGPGLDAPARQPWEPKPVDRPLPEPWAARLWSLVDRGLADFTPITAGDDPYAEPGCSGDWVAVTMGDASLRVHRGAEGRVYRDLVKPAWSDVWPLPPDPEPLIPCGAVLTVGDRSWSIMDLRVELLANDVSAIER